MRRAVSLSLAVALAFVLGAENIVNRANALDPSSVVYQWGWLMTRLPTGSLSPQYKLLWTRSPAWFPDQNRGGQHEGLIRRLANTQNGLVTLINRTFYLLDRQSGKTLWSHSLQGEIDVTDWRERDSVVFFAAIDYTEPKNITGLRGAIDVAGRKLLWLERLTDKQRYKGGGSPEWILPIDNQRVLFTTQYSHVFFLGPLEILESRSGKKILSFEKGFGYLEDSGWFIVEQRLYALLGPKSGGIYIKSYDLANGRSSTREHVFGDGKIGNLPFAFAVAGDETLVLAYRPLSKWDQQTTFVGYDLGRRKVIWEKTYPETTTRLSNFVKRLLPISGDSYSIAALSNPNGFIVLDRRDGAVVKQGRASGYLGWDGSQAVLYGYPYVLAGARRSLDKGMAYDVVGLNLETGNIDWSYEIDREDAIAATPRAEILNFAFADGNVYLSRHDGHVMAFQPIK